MLTQADMPEQGMYKLCIHYFTMTEYDKTYENVHVLFDSQDLKNTLGEILAGADKTQLRAAETEKYPHVTFFFNGGREEPFEGEDRVMAASPKVATYDLQDRKSTRLNSSHDQISYAVFCLKKKKKHKDVKSRTTNSKQQHNTQGNQERKIQKRKTRA